MQFQPSGRMKRREFLARAAGIVAAAGCSRSFARAAGPTPPAPWTMRLSTSSVQFGSLSVEETCRAISAAGFEAVDFWDDIFHCTHLSEIENRLGAEGLKELLAKHKLTLCGFSCYGQGYPRRAELLGKAGGGVAIRGSRPGKPDNLRAEMKDFIERLKPEIELAEKYGSSIAVENHRNALLDGLDSLKAFVEFSPSPRLGIALAPYHLQALGASVAEAVAIAGRRLFFFYAWQHGEGLNQLPSFGPADFTPWLAALAETGYRGWVNPFMHGHPAPETMSKSLVKAKDYLLRRAATLKGRE